MSEKPFDYYLPFSTIDFVMDEEFQAWILHPTPEREAYWQSFPVAFPQKSDNVYEARLIVQNMRVADWQRVQPAETSYLFQQLQNRIDAMEQPKVIPLYRQRWWQMAAAVGLISGLLGAYWYGYRPQEYQTAYGETLSLTLPDQTVVTLGANSHLHTPGRWPFLDNREVRLTGEAYFDVKKRLTGASSRQPFRVFTQQLTIDVLGTRFNVNTYRGRTSVLLDEGQVRLRENDQPAKTVLLRPGQIAQWQATSRNIAIQLVRNASDLTAWKQNRLVFHDASLNELSQRIQEVYGIALVFDGAGWQDITFTGVLPAQDTNKATQILNETLGGTIVQESGRIIFRKE